MSAFDRKRAFDAAGVNPDLGEFLHEKAVGLDDAITILRSSILPSHWAALLDHGVTGPDLAWLAEQEDGAGVRASSTSDFEAVISITDTDQRRFALLVATRGLHGPDLAAALSAVLGSDGTVARLLLDGWSAVDAVKASLALKDAPYAAVGAAAAGDARPLRVAQRPVVSDQAAARQQD